MLSNCGVEDFWEPLGLQGRSNRSILKEINSEYSLEGLVLRLKLQYTGHLMQRANSLEKTLVLGKIEGRRRGRQKMRWRMASPTQWTLVWANSRRWWKTGKLACCSPRGCKESDTTEQLNKQEQWTGWQTDIQVYRSSNRDQGISLMVQWAALVDQTVKNLPSMRETWVQSLGREVPLEKEMATHSSILAWKISWTEEPGGLQSLQLRRVGHVWATNTFTFTSG